MVCIRAQPGAALSNEALFQKAFADRFASLDSLVSSSPESEGGCPPCAAMLAQPPVRGGGGGSQLAQWIIFTLLLSGIILVLYYIFERMRGRRKHHHHQHARPGTAGGSHMGTHVGMPQVGGGPPAKAAAASAAVVVTDPGSAKKTNGNRLLVVFLHADWCHHCKQTLPEFEAVAKQYQDRVDFKTAENAVMKGSQLVEDIGLQGFPTTIFVIKDQIVDTKVGGYKSDALKQIVDKLLAQAGNQP